MITARFIQLLAVVLLAFAIQRPESAHALISKNLGELKARLAVEIEKKSCGSALALANAVYHEDPNDISALQTIVKCTRSQQHVTEYAQHAKEIFERSRILSIIPKLLEVAQVKELIPILREVETKKDKTVADYLMINEIYERLDEPEKQLAVLQEAVKVNPGDPRLFAILAKKQFMANQQDLLRNATLGLLQNYLSQIAEQPAQIYLLAYVLALAYPIPLALTLVACIWMLACVIWVKRATVANDWQDLNLRMPLLVLIVPSLLAFRFWQTGKALPVGALLLIICAQTFILLNPYFSKIYTPVFAFAGRVLFFVFNGTILAKKLAALSLGSRVLVAFGTLLVLGVFAPTIDIPDLKYGLIIFCSMVLYAIIGSLMISFLRSRESLIVSLRWIGIVATFPFLISYLISNWHSLGTPLMYGEWPSHSAIDSLASYLVFWGVSFFLALHLGKIIAQAFIKPITEIIEKVALIEKGNFGAKVEIFSKDEIGHLGHAINRMGYGLGKREKIEKTFRKYVDQKIAQRILDGVETELRIEGQEVNAVVLFADIRGFTSMSEKTAPGDVVRMLNQFFERMVKIVQKNGGVIDKFIGDNMMAVWGIPYAIEDAEKKAITASLEMREEMKAWNLELKKQGFGEVGIGIGLNVGPVIAGSIGSSDHMEYTVIGDTVNTAQRAESVAKKQQIVVTDAFFDRVKHLVDATALEPVQVKGKEGLQHWYSVTGVREPVQKAV